jgi:hypothetical protein
METAASVIKSALQEILIQASESDLEADEYQDGLIYLNRMMTSYAADGINLGYTNVTNLGSPITVPDGAIMGMVKNLAVMLWSQFSEPGTPIDPVLLRAAEQEKLVMRTLGVAKIGPSSLAGAPIGSGSECDWQPTHFYPEDPNNISTEQGNFIATEDNTEVP